MGGIPGLLSWGAGIPDLSFRCAGNQLSVARALWLRVWGCGSVLGQALPVGAFHRIVLLRRGYPGVLPTWHILISCAAESQEPNVVVQILAIMSTGSMEVPDRHCDVLL